MRRFFGFNNKPVPQTMWDGTEVREPERKEEPVVEPEKAPDADTNYYRDVLLPMILLKEQETLARQPDELARYEKELEDHRAGFHISCRRHGDFLAIYMTRLANKGGDKTIDKYCLMPPKKFAIMVNLAQISFIRRIDGKAPDLSGAIVYQGVIMKNGERHSDNWDYTTKSMVLLRKPPREGETHVIEAEVRGDYFPSSPYGSFMYSRPSSGTHYSHPYNGNVNHRNETGGALRSVDDRIVFTDDIIINIPYGLGEEAERTIQEAIAEGYTPVVLPTVRRRPFQDVSEDIFKRLEIVLRSAVEKRIVSNAELTLDYDNCDGGGGWSVLVGNPRPNDGNLGTVEPDLMVGPYGTADEAVLAMIEILEDRFIMLAGT